MQFGVNIWTILKVNNLSDPDMLKPGTQLKVLPVNGVEHEVQDGESLNDIAAYYEIDLGPVVDFNAISDPNNLTPGERLTIPGTDRTPPAGSLAALGSQLTVPGQPQPTVRAPEPVASAPQARSSRAAAEAARPSSQAMLAQAAPKPESNAQTAAKPQASAQAQPAAKPQVSAQAQPAAKPQASTQAAAKPQPSPPQAAAKPQTQTAQAPNRLAAASVGAPTAIAGAGNSGSGNSAAVGTAMKYLGTRYVFGGTSPAGFDCSGFIWYVQNAVNKPVSRGMFGQLSSGSRVSKDQLRPGDLVFFANTYTAGLSHSGIYIGGGQFIHAKDESSGVTISNMNDGYWGQRYVGGTRPN